MSARRGEGTGQRLHSSLSRFRVRLRRGSRRGEKGKRKKGQEERRREEERRARRSSNRKEEGGCGESKEGGGAKGRHIRADTASTADDGLGGGSGRLGKSRPRPRAAASCSGRMAIVPCRARRAGRGFFVCVSAHVLTRRGVGFDRMRAAPFSRHNVARALGASGSGWCSLVAFAASPSVDDKFRFC
jgi:hypothetical protein